MNCKVKKGKNKIDVSCKFKDSKDLYKFLVSKNNPKMVWKNGRVGIKVGNTVKWQ